jgi:hypothetical protein
MNKILLFLLILFSTIETYGQEHTYYTMLGKNESQIKDYMKETSGVLKFSKLVEGPADIKSWKQLLYVFPISQAKNADIFQAMFMINENGNCFQYIVLYKENKIMNNLIKQFDQPALGFTREGKSLEWKKGHMKINILKIRSSAPTTKTAFSVQGILN